MSKEKKFESLQIELSPYKSVLGKASDIIMEKEVSNFPIFVFHQHDIEVGIPIVDKNTSKGNWNINASSLEEFSSKSLIQQEKVEEFIKVFKDPKENICLFVISELGAQFIFINRN